MKKYKIGFFPISNFDTAELSCTQQFMLQALNKYFDVSIVTLDIKTPNTHQTFKDFLQELILQKKKSADVIAYLKRLGQSLQKKIDQHDFSCLFFPNNEIVAFMDLKRPAILSSDSFMVDHYQQDTVVSRSYSKITNVIRRRILSRPVHIQLSTFMGIKLVHDDKIFTTKNMYSIPYGANLNKPLSREDVFFCRKNADRSVCRLLFNGLDWKNDGGEIAFQIMQELNQDGLPTELIAYKCDVPKEFNHPQFKALGCLQKGNSKELCRLKEQYEKRKQIIPQLLLLRLRPGRCL